MLLEKNFLLNNLSLHSFFFFKITVASSFSKHAYTEAYRMLVVFVCCLHEIGILLYCNLQPYKREVTQNQGRPTETLISVTKLPLLSILYINSF